MFKAALAFLVIPVIGYFSASFDDNTRALIYDYLEAIAHSDDDLADDEKALLDGL